MSEKNTFEGFAILELMGHRRLAGYVSEQEIAGAGMIRIDIPGEQGLATTQLYSPSALYCLTPTTEEVARALATRHQPKPVQPWELPSASAESRTERAEDFEEEPFEVEGEEWGESPF